MSKQLIHSFKSHVIVVALSDRAFAAVANEKSSDAQVVELIPPVTAEKKSKSNGKDDNDKAKPDSDETYDMKEGMCSTSQELKSTDDIQAVCSTQIDSRTWLAVSREDKTLSLYCVSDSIRNKNGTTKLQPLAIYNMPKRARCLLFSNVASSSAKEDCNIIIAGDLSGDSYAYPVPSRDSRHGCAAATAKPSRRLLLGHTASILTGMQIVPSFNGGVGKRFILTADRDEKVRVTSFPETYNIHGYLLGHTAFISDMDAASCTEDGVRPLCLTGSGDGTVRLWDYQTCKEVGMVPVMLKAFDNDKCDMKDNEEDEDAVDDDNKCDQEADEGECDDDDDDIDEDYDGLIAVPNSVAISSDASYVAVARNGVNSVDIHPIPTPVKKSSSSSSLLLSRLMSLHKKQTLTCPSQPLNICLLSNGSLIVLVREPEYILHFKCSGPDLEFEDISSTSPLCSALVSIAASQNIVMPATTLEYNEDGTYKLQKKIDDREFDNDAGEEDAGGKGGTHWNDKERRNTHRLANGRRRKRKLKDSK